MDRLDYVTKRKKLLKENFTVYNREIALHVYSFEEAEILAKALKSLGLTWMSGRDLLNFDILKDYYKKDRMKGENKEIFEFIINMNVDTCDNIVARSMRGALPIATQEVLGNLSFKETITKLKNIRKELRNGTI